MLAKIVVGILALPVVYFFGAMSARHAIFPWPQISALRAEWSGRDVALSSRYIFETDGRLSVDETKTAVSCPSQTRHTAVLLVLGQSNAANHAGQRSRSVHGPRVINFYNGRCYLSASPLLGSTNAGGEQWTLLGNLLVESGKVDNVLIAPFAFSGSNVARWSHGGDLNGLLIDVLRQLENSDYKVTDVLWTQGESDYVLGTSKEIYRREFLSLVETLRGHSITAPVYVSLATKCLEPSNGGLKFHAKNNPVFQAQLALAQEGKGIRLGVNSDELLDETDRYDDCHFGGSGTQKVAQAWMNILFADQKELVEQ